MISIDAMDPINRGIPVFIKKPITLNAHDAEKLYSRAAPKTVLIRPDFQQLFHPAFQHALSIIDSGLLGRVVHVESHWSGKLDTQIAGEGRLHWSFELPGSELRNNITQLLYLVLYFIGMPERVIVSAKSYGIMDYLNIMLEGKQCTASVVQSLVIGPQTFYVWIFCENGAVLVNFETSTVLVRRKSSMPRSFNRAISTYKDAYQLCAYGIKNIISFMRRRLVPYQGLQTLVPRFYASINDSTDPPVSRELALAVTNTEETVFGQASGDDIRQTCEVNGGPKSRSQIRDNVEITLRDSLLS
jgi:predicted dehydrogenase